MLSRMRLALFAAGFGLAISGAALAQTQAQQPTTPDTATAPGTASSVPGHPEHGMGTGSTMGQQSHGPTTGGEHGMVGGQGHPGPMGGSTPCPEGQTASGMPPTCK